MLKTYFNIDNVGASRFSSTRSLDTHLQFPYKQGVTYRVQVFTGWRDFSPVNSADVLYEFTATNAAAMDKARFMSGICASAAPLDVVTFGAETQSFFILGSASFINTIATFWICPYWEGIFRDDISDGVFGLEWGTVTGLHLTLRAPGSFIMAEAILEASESL